MLLQKLLKILHFNFQTLDQDLQQELKGKVSTAIEGAQNVQMKEIRGLGDRLSGLEQLLLEAKRLVQEQQKLAAAFVQNQQRASGLRDVSILPDLCASHRQQLLVMQKNHQQIISICNRSGWLLFTVCSFSFGPN
jgi:RB1-inducible coiled-coil protein 1